MLDEDDLAIMRKDHKRDKVNREVTRRGSFTPSGMAGTLGGSVRAFSPALSPRVRQQIMAKRRKSILHKISSVRNPRASEEGLETPAGTRDRKQSVW